MTNANDDQPPATTGHDRRAFLQRAGIGAAAVGAWVAPQVLFTSSAAAGCTPITKLLQINAASLLAVEPTTFDPNLPSCPSGWASGRSDGVTFGIAPVGITAIRGATITIYSAGCRPTSGYAVRWCPGQSGPDYTCEPGLASGTTIIFPLLSPPPFCFYLDFRIFIECCT